MLIDLVDDYISKFMIVPYKDGYMISHLFKKEVIDENTIHVIGASDEMNESVLKHLIYTEAAHADYSKCLISYIENCFFNLVD